MNNYKPEYKTRIIESVQDNIMVLVVLLVIVIVPGVFMYFAVKQLEDSVWYESPTQENYRIHQECALGYRPNEDFCNSPEIKNPKASAWDKRYIEKKYPELF